MHIEAGQPRRFDAGLHRSSNPKIIWFYIISKHHVFTVSKKFFKLAVKRNKIKRRIKEVFRKHGLCASGGVIIFSVFKPFAELSYEEARSEIDHAVGLLKES